MMKMLLLLAPALQLASAAACCGALAPFLAAANHSAAALSEQLVCTDQHAACASWAAGGECQKNAGFMNDACRVSCNKCGLSPSDAIQAAEFALVATRNLALACEYGSAGPAAAICAGVANDLPRLREGRVSETDLRESASSVARKVHIACENPMHCQLGDGPHRVPAALTEAPPQASAAAGESYFMLPHDVKMPKIGLGTWLTVGAECTAMVAAALRAGLRHIDTSENYANHEAIGAALAASSVPRQELFLADKISHPTSYSAEGVRAWVSTSLAALRTDYLDLLMLHSIGPSVAARNEAWATMEQMRAEGLVRAIGTSNFGTREMEQLRAAAKSEPPATHQIKFNPYHQGRTGNAGGEDFSADCEKGGCVVVAYCPLNSWPSKLAPIHDEWVRHIATKYGRTPSQVLLRWAIQRGAAPLTRSRSEARLREALGALEFTLSDADVRLLSGLAWHVEATSHRPAASVADVFGIARLHGAGGEGDRVEL